MLKSSFCNQVSIPFKRESVSEPVEKTSVNYQHSNWFQFPSNGKAYLNERIMVRARSYGLQFQFPSNGKAYLNPSDIGPEGKQTKKFQFPSNGKAYLNVEPGRLLTTATLFQFPSNGKAYLNRYWEISRIGTDLRFNSLQTGKRIWT